MNHGLLRVVKKMFKACKRWWGASPRLASASGSPTTTTIGTTILALLASGSSEVLAPASPLALEPLTVGKGLSNFVLWEIKNTPLMSRNVEPLKGTGDGSLTSA